jgi:hypothetical protein
LKKSTSLVLIERGNDGVHYRQYKGRSKQYHIVSEERPLTAREVEQFRCYPVAFMGNTEPDVA